MTASELPLTCRNGVSSLAPGGSGFSPVRGIDVSKKGWTDSKAFKKLSARLYQKEGHDFEKDVLSLLRIAYPEVVPASPLGTVDRSGVDILHWSDKEPFPLVVQCKGFKQLEMSLGDSQIKQCAKSIRSFKKSGIHAERNLLIINRRLQGDDFRNTVKAQVQELEMSGVVKEARLLGIELLLQEVLRSAAKRVREQLVAGSDDLSRVVENDSALGVEPLEDVPTTSSTLVANQYRLLAPVDRVPESTSPYAMLSSGRSEDPLTLVIGRAGMGKSTLARRLSRSDATKKTIYVPASSFSAEIQSANDLVRACFQDQDVFFGEEIPTEIAEPILTSVLAYHLRDPQSPLRLVIDGLDESIYFTQRGGLQKLFNKLRDIRAQVVLTARAELWNSRQSDFSVAFGEPASADKTVNRKFRLITLEEWSDSHIETYVRRRIGSERDPLRAAHLEKLAELVRGGGYLEYFGTVPRTPLFLQLVVEVVASEGIRPSDRASLLESWARGKVIRDFVAPLAFDQVGREMIASGVESPDTSVELSFRIMEAASGLMLHESPPGVMQLLPSCSFTKIREVVNESIALEMSALVSNSLLVPVPNTSTVDRRVQFSHRVYQEYFLARWILSSADRSTKKWPDEILSWMCEVGLTDSHKYA